MVGMYSESTCLGPCVPIMFPIWGPQSIPFVLAVDVERVRAKDRKDHLVGLLARKKYC